MELTKMTNTLKDAITEARAITIDLHEYARDWAEAEKDYQIIKRKQIMHMKEEGMPVTLINETVRGVPHVAEAKFLRDLAQETLKAQHKLSSVLSDSISATQSLLKYHSEL